MINKIEQEIMKNWKGDTSSPVVSVCCITFNHENYIMEALDSFLMQETDFSFEIIVHDDASTDNTTNIIKKYEKRFPNIIKPIYQVENQYKKNIRIMASFPIRKAKGEYLAFCEGDDYWNDKEKLKIQYYGLINSDCEASCHPSIVKKYKNQVITEQKYSYGYYGENDKVISTEEILKAGGGAFGLSSVFVKTSKIRYLEDIDILFYEKRLTHFYFQLFSSLDNGVLYIPLHLSVYRSNHEGSWSYENENNVVSYKNNFVRYFESLICFNDITKQKYSSIIKVVLHKRLAGFLLQKKISNEEKIIMFNKFKSHVNVSFYYLLIFLLKTNLYKIIVLIRNSVSMNND